MTPNTFISARKITSFHTVSSAHFVPLALQLSRQFQHLHDATLSHQHVSPNTILISSNMEHAFIRHIYPAIPFETSHELSHQGIPGAHMTDYISPEQRLRIAKTIDFRSDIYSLGMVFYYILTKQHPISDDCGTPLLYYPDNCEVPSQIRQILSKMTARFPEDRYQSFTSVIKDLTYYTKAAAPVFFAGLSDTPEQLYDTRHLFGRETEIETLHQALKSPISSQLITLTGESGVGKTTLIQNVISQLYHQKKAVVYTHASSTQQSPFPTLSKVISSVLSTLITKENASFWSHQIHTQLRSHTLLVAAAIPELSTLLFYGAHDRTDVRPDSHKLFYAYTELFKLIANHSKGTVVIIDDAHWMSKLECELLNTFISHSNPNARFIISYRPSESTPSLHDLLNRVDPDTISLHNLPFTTVLEWVNCQFNQTPKTNPNLIKLLYKRTEGNPYKIKATFHHLQKKNKLTFQKGIRKWILDLNMSNSESQCKHTHYTQRT